MTREFRWHPQIAGKTRVIRCVDSGNQYTIYADDEQVSVLRRGLNYRSQGMDEEITICGEKCRFVVWNEQPDIVVRNRLIGANVDYQLEIENRRKSYMMTGVGIAAVGLIIMIIGGVLMAVLQNDGRDYSTVILGGLILLAWGIHWWNKWRKTGNQVDTKA